MELHDQAIQDIEYVKQVEEDPLTDSRLMYKNQCQQNKKWDIIIV